MTFKGVLIGNCSSPTTPILGHNACERLGLIQRIESVAAPLTKEQFFDQYQDVFSGLGQHNQEYDIGVDPEVPPVVQPARRVPYAKHDKLAATLEELEKRGVVAKVDKPAPWVSNLVITEKKDGRMRICLDPKPLNSAIKRERYQMPTPNDLQRQFNVKRVFTVIDMADGYRHVKFTDKSSYLCTFHSPWVRRRFLRMPFGILSASEVMQKRNDDVFRSIPGVNVIADDMIIAAETEEEHDRILHDVMKRAR